MKLPQLFPFHRGLDEDTPSFPTPWGPPCGTQQASSASSSSGALSITSVTHLGKLRQGKGMPLAQGKRQKPHSKTLGKGAVIYILEERSGKPRDRWDKRPATSVPCSGHQLCLPPSTGLHTDVPLTPHWFAQARHTGLHEDAVLIQPAPARPAAAPSPFCGES